MQAEYQESEFTTLRSADIREPSTASGGNYSPRLFLLVLLLVSVAGLSYTWLRPAEFQGSAILRLRDVGLQAEESNAVQLHATLVKDQLVLYLKRLQSPRLMTQLATQLEDEPALETVPDTAQLGEMLAAEIIDDALLIELNARGSDPVILQTVLQNWMDLFLLQTNSDQTLTETAQMRKTRADLAAVDQRIVQQRAELNAYRTQHQIVSLERDESRTLNRMKSLGSSLDSSIDARVAAQAQITAIQAGLAQGQYMVRPQDQPGIDTLESRIVQLKEELLAQSDLYTDTYMRFHPRSLELQQSLAMLERSLEDKRQQSQQNYLQETKRALIAAQAKEKVLREQISALQEEIYNFSNRYEAYESMRATLERLESRAQELHSSVIQQQLKSPLQTRFQIVERPYTATHPNHPQYWRDTAITVGIGVLAGLMAVYIRRFLNRERLHPEQDAIYTILSGMLPQQSLPADNAALPPSQVALEEHPLNEDKTHYSPAEISQLLQTAEKSTALTVHMLLCGARPAELAAIRWRDVNLASAHLSISAGARRNLDLSPACVALCRELMPAVPGAGIPLWINAEGHSQPLSMLDAALRYDLHRAELPQPLPNASADAALQAIWRSYVLFILEQGPHINELGQLFGPLTTQERNEFRNLLPAGSNKTVDELELRYPYE